MSKLILILDKKCCFVFILLSTVAQCAPNFGTNMRRFFLADTDLGGTIKLLEKEQSKLYKSINNLLSESVRDLQNEILPELSPVIDKLNSFRKKFKRVHIKDVLNRYDQIDAGLDREIEDLRRTFRRNKRPSQAEERLFDPDRIYDGLKDPFIDWRIKNKERIEGRFLNWLQEKKQERKREYRLKKEEHKKIYRFEHCPDHGVDKRKDGTVVKFPCCRKCCKLSEMGCQ